MPVNKTFATKRGKAAVAAAIMAAAMAGWQGFKDTNPTKHVYPPAVILATEALIEPWEGTVLTAHWDPFAKIYDICHGKTRFNGKPVTKGMKFTKEECADFLEADLYNDYYLPLTKKIPGFTSFPIGNQAAMISGAYNFGVAAMVNSTATGLALKGQWEAACDAQTAFNKAGGVRVPGLVKRREMGDDYRKGEAEICKSGQVTK
jgi:GH24 family phage-related lysozyme (muramidase)